MKSQKKIKQNIHTVYSWQSQDLNSRPAWCWGSSLTVVLSCLTQLKLRRLWFLLATLSLKVFCSLSFLYPPKPSQTSWLTSKRFCRVGTSTAVKSAKDLNWALVWSLRKVSTGTTPSGWIQISNSLKQDTCRHGPGGRDNTEPPREQLTSADSLI